MILSDEDIEGDEEEADGDEDEEQEDDDEYSTEYEEEVQLQPFDYANSSNHVSKLSFNVSLFRCDSSFEAFFFRSFLRQKSSSI